MRTNQCSIFIERFGESVPKSYPGEVQRISVYVDDFNSIYAALSKAYAMAINELAEYETIGCRADVSTNEFASSDYKQMHGTIPKSKRKFSDDINRDFYDTEYEMCKDYIWFFNQSKEIIDLIKMADSTDDMRIALKERYHLSDYQIRKLSQIRMDMLTRDEYQRCQNKILEIEAWRDTRKNKKDVTFTIGNESYQRDVRKRLAKEKTRKKELDAYFVIAENYSNMIKIMEENTEFSAFAKIMKEKYSLDYKQCKYFQYMSINDFTNKSREEKRLLLKRVVENIEFLEGELIG